MASLSHTVRFAVTYTKDVHKKQRKQWLDGELEVNRSTRSARLFPEGGDQGGSATTPIARIDALPEDVSLDHGGGDEFVMCRGDRGKEYLVQVDEVVSAGRDEVAPGFTMPMHSIEVGFKQLTARSKPQRGKVFVDTKRQPVVEANVESEGRQVQSQARGQAVPRNVRPVSIPARQRQEPQVTHKRRKRNTQEILDLLGIEVKGFKETGLAARRPPAENVDVNMNGDEAVQRAVQQTKGKDVPHNGFSVSEGRPSVQPAPAVQHGRQASAWTSKPVEKVLRATISSKVRAPGSEVAKTVAHSDRMRQDSSVANISAVALPQVHAPPLQTQPATFDGSALVCPTAEESARPVRTIRIPTSFDTTWDYLTTMKKAVLEEAHLRIIESTTAVFFAARDGSDVGTAGGKKSSKFGTGKKKVPFDHGQCQIKIWRNNNKGDETAKHESVYLHLGAHRLSASEYRKSDVWLLSNDPGFGSGPIQKVTTWTCVVRSLWHGPNKDGKFEVEFVSERPRHMGSKCHVWALKGPDVSIEIDLANVVLEGVLRDGKAPIINGLLSKVSGPAFLQSAEDLARDMPAFNETSDRFRLNEHQRKALMNIAVWHVSPETRPVCLVHGPFGSGKSQLMVAMLHLILKLRHTEGGLSNARVMVSSHTNIAVDRVCLGLIESGVTDFLRVGALRKIHVDLLGRSLHASESKTHASALSELKDMAKGAQGRLLTKLKLEIAEVERGADRQRKKLLKTCPIVGVTCVSTSLEALQGQTFDVLLLDEASQLTEPLSLAPAIRSRCKYLIAAGDPNQLPPVVCSPDHVRGDRLNSLVRPMFVRLVGLGHEPYLLKTQYRCHPDISEVCNRFFYGSQLEDGVGRDQRRSLLPSMKHAVAVVDVEGQELYRGRSVYNEAEARAAGLLVRNLVQCGIAPNDIGVIAFYRAHVDALKRSVGGLCAGDSAPGDVQIATVDSFQGAEKQVIILSTATTKASSFASDVCRLNVALSRAKNHLFLVTNQVLCKGVPCLDYIVRRSQAQGGYFLGGATL